MKIKVCFKVIFILLLILNLALPIMAKEDIEENEGNFSISKFEDKVDVPPELNNLTNNTLGTAISIARIVGVGIAVVILMVIACKYMMAAPGDRADIKKNAVPYVIGAIVLFGTTGILGIIADIAEVI